MGHPADADEFFEVSGNELGTVVADDPGMNARVALTSPLDDRFDVTLFHLRADFPVHDRSAETIEQAAKEEEGFPDVDIGDVDVPMLVRPERLMEPRSLERNLGVLPFHQPRIAKHAVDARRAYRHDIGVEHHEGETTVSLKWVPIVKINDGLFFPVFEPSIAWNPAIVLVNLAVTLPPVVELALSDAQPGDKLLGRDLRPIRPITGVVDDLITSVVGNPGSSQSSPSSFFSLTCSSMSSATTSFLR